MKRSPALLLWIIAALGWVATASVAEEPAPYAREVKAVHRFIDTDKLEQTATETISILSPSAVRQFAEIKLRLNENFQEMVVLEGETIKADGRRVKVEPSGILKATLPNSAQMGIFEADVVERTIVFPNVEVGDKVTYTRTIRDKRRFALGGVDVKWSFWPTARYTSATVTIDAPADLELFAKSDGVSLEESRPGDRRVMTWSIGPQPYKAAEQGAVSFTDTAPFVMVTTRKSDETLGRAFERAATAAGAVTPNVAKLADKITKGITDRRAQAKAIHDYVATNIRYFLVLLGNSGWVPRDADKIIETKFGDCKDHVTLMRALLQAKGIQSEFALIAIFTNSFRDFGLPLNTYNHVIVYIPEFDLYSDPTASNVAFGALPQGQPGQAVLRIGEAGVVKTRIPVRQAEGSRLSITADVTLRPDGTPVGTAEWTGVGVPAAALRNIVSQTETTGRVKLAETILKQRNWRGTGEIGSHDARNLGDPYTVRTSFDLENAYFGKGANRNPIPFGPALLSAGYLGNLSYARDGRESDVPCYSGIWEAKAAIKLPPGKRLASVPPSVKIEAGGASYEASYVLDGDTLRVERRWRTDTDKPTCTRAVILATIPVAQAARRDTGVRLQFEGDAAPEQPPLDE